MGAEKEESTKKKLDAREEDSGRKRLHEHDEEA
jgi:hypothetical protein